MAAPLDETNNLRKEVLHVTSETSDKYVQAPDRNQILSDLLIGLKRFRNVVRWKWYFAEKKRIEKEAKERLTSQNTFSSKPNIDEEDNEKTKIKANQEGLNSGLKATNLTQNAPIGSIETEGFLKEVERALITQVSESKISTTERDKKILDIFKLLRTSEDVVIATDKTNSHRVIPVEKYKTWVKGHLDKAAKEISRERISEIFEHANETCEEYSDILNDNENNFLKSTLKTKNIPTPKLIIKDHKKPDEEGDFPSRLIVPANNFTSAFPRLGYLGIRRIFDKNNIEYESRTITQASSLKEELEELKISKRQVTIAKLDIVAMYPSIQFKLVRKAVEFFSKSLTKRDKKKIEKCLEMVKFGMSNTLVSFIDKFYEYDGDLDDEERGLTIGGYESAWLADLVASYILEKTKKMFHKTKYHGIYRDDGFVVFNGVVSKKAVNNWVRVFQWNVDRLAECDCLQFTMEVWGKDDDPTILNEKLTYVDEAHFPYLDMEMHWNDRGELKFQIYIKPNQKLKYLNSDSTHLPSTFRAIPKGVLERLCNLTSKSKQSERITIDKLYPLHCAALKTAGLAPKEFPTLLELRNFKKLRSTEEKEKEKSEKKKKQSRQTYFCIGVSTVSMRTARHPPFHETITKIRNKFNLKWLRVSMSYHKFPNLGQLFQSDLTTKLTKGLESLDFMDLPCNCNVRTKVNGKCWFNGECRKSIVVYKAKCKLCEMSYIGNTQQKLKTRVNQHLTEVCALVNKRKTSDTFAKHFAAHYSTDNGKLNAGEARKMMDISIVWQGNAISCNKSFGKMNCILCMKERFIILRLTKKDPAGIINTSNEFYGACRHKPRFHRYTTTTCPPVLMTNESSERVRPDLTVRTPPVLPDSSLQVCIEIPNPLGETELDTV